MQIRQPADEHGTVVLEPCVSPPAGSIGPRPDVERGRHSTSGEQRSQGESLRETLIGTQQHASETIDGGRGPLGRDRSPLAAERTPRGRSGRNDAIGGTREVISGSSPCSNDLEEGADQEHGIHTPAWAQSANRP